MQREMWLRDRLGGEAIGVVGTQEELQVLVDEKSSELSSVTTARDEANAIVARVKPVEVDINAKLEDAKFLAEEHAGKATHWQRELAKGTLPPIHISQPTSPLPRA